MDHERTRLRWPAPWEISPRRLFSKILSGPLILLVTILLCSTTAYAAEVQEERAPPGRMAIDGIQILKDVQDAQDFSLEDAKPGVQCTHHPEHTEECGYVPGVEGVPCAHQHDEGCGYIEPQEGTTCTHTHDTLCGYADAVPEVPCDKGCTPDETGTLVHAPDCAYTPAAAEIPCGHVHDGNCGYAEPVAGAPCGHVHDETCGFVEEKAEVPCGFVCAICSEEPGPTPAPDPEPGQEEDLQPPEDPEVPSEPEPVPPAEVLSWEWIDEDGVLIYSEETGTWGLGVPGVSAEQRLTAEILQEVLPKEITATLAESVQQAISLTWDLSSVPEEGVYEESFVLSAGLPETYILSENASKLDILVELGGGEVYDVQNIALNEWIWEGFDVPGKDTVLVINSDEVMENNGDIFTVLNSILPKRIYGWSTGPKYTDGPFTKADIKNDEKYDQNGKLYSTQYYGYLEVDWTGLKSQLDNITKYDDPFVLEARKPTYGEVKYFINDGIGAPNCEDLLITIRLVSFSNHTVSAAEPENVTVNLFDYWVETEKPTKDTNGDILTKSDNHYHEEGGEGAPSTTATKYSSVDDWNKGINLNHLLLFGDGMIHAGLWNKGAGENCRYGNTYAGMEGIVKNVLSENGYPEINTENATKQMMGVAEKGPADNPNPNYRDYTLIKDYKLTGDHNSSKGDQYDSDNIQNLSYTVIQTWGKDIAKDGESLQYLFDPEFNHNYKTSYTNVTGLFQLDKDGYYYYNMRENFAEFVEDKDNKDNHFILYNAPATTRTDGEKSVGNFFPFNKGSEVFNSIDENGELTSSVTCSGNTMNHHLGMTVTAEFRQPANGKINTSGGNQQNMSFGFSGDDDVWVFVDDVLVLDIGGIHSELYGTIDFATGDVYIGRAFGVNGVPENPSDPDIMVTHTNLLDLYKAANMEGTTKWNGNTFASNTSHTLKMFYLERGNYDSSIALRFNLQPLLYQRIAKVDQNGQAIEGVKFDLYEAKIAEEEAPDAIECLYTDSNIANGEPFYVVQKETDALVHLTTDEFGSAVFLTEDGSYFNFADRGDQYYLLKETTTADGYRKQPVPIVLHYDARSSMLSVANRWTTGAYACSVSNVTGPVKRTEGRDGLVVAVPLLKRKTDDNWLALYGSNISGFHSEMVGKVEKITEIDQIEGHKDVILKAALEQAMDENTASWYLDWDTNNQRLTGQLYDLPGLASRYLLINPTGGDMHMVYGLISADALKSLGIKGNTPVERYATLREYLQDEENAGVFDTLKGSFKLLDINDFNRDFRSLIYIPNERRELRVMKIDQDGNPLAGAEFTLYDKENQKVASGTTDETGTLIFSPNAKRDSDNNVVQGQAEMVWADVTEDTRYYLKETKAPEGCSLNPTTIPVVVGIYSIYADAGEANDGVSVMAGAGKLTQTMRQYAIGGDVDITLQDITAFMQTQESGTFSLTGWKDAMLEGTSVLRSMNLHFGLNAVVDYGLHDQDGGKIFTPFFLTDTGFIRTRIEQISPDDHIRYELENHNKDANRDILGKIDLTNLFSLLNIIVVTDQTDPITETGQLTISKTVNKNGPSNSWTDDEEEYTRLYKFTVTLTDSSGNPLDGSYEYRFYGKDKSGEIKNNGTLLLHHDESVTILGLPVGTKWVVVEADDPNDHPAHEEWPVSPGFVIEGTIGEDETAQANFVNNQKPPVATGTLTVKKTVKDPKEDDDSISFVFTLGLKDAEKNPLEGTYLYRRSDNMEGYIGNEGTFSLHHNESITIYGLPLGTIFALTEGLVDGWNEQKTFTDLIEDSAPVEVSFVNSRTETSPPGSENPPGGDDPKPPDKPDKPVTPPPEEPEQPPEEDPEEPPVIPGDPSDPGRPGTPDGPTDPADPDEPVFIVGDPEVPFFGWNLPDEPVPTFGPPPDGPGTPPERRSDVPLTGERGRQDLALLLGSLLGLGVLYVGNRKKKSA